MNIYEKLQALRVHLLSQRMRKSGRNDFAKYDYFELEDFMPIVIAKMHELKLCSQVSFSSEMGSLTIYNSEMPSEFVDFSSPMATANLKGNHDVQNLGAVQTYLRRYLWVAALEIVEHDAINKTTNPKEAPPIKSQPENTNAAINEPPADIKEPVVQSRTISPEQQKKIIEVSKKNGWTAKMSKAFLADKGFASSSMINEADYDDIIDAFADKLMWEYYSENTK